MTDPLQPFKRVKQCGACFMHGFLISEKVLPDRRIRRKQCAICYHRFGTVELLITDLQQRLADARKEGGKT